MKRAARVFAALSVALAGSLFGATPARAGASPIRLVDAPCAGCRASFPAGASAPPLLVVLHGDWGPGAPELLAAWEKHAIARGVAVLSLACPKDRGCDRSWWRWNGDPSWLREQVDALAKLRPIDRERVWLAGFSGGASYIGMRAPELQRSFGALVYHAGGVPPSGGCVAGGAPAYFLSGSKNPLQHLAIALRKHHEACGDGVVWDGLAGADHTAEWRALDAHGGAIVDWLLPKKRHL